jgi:cell division protein FtsB
VDNLPADPVDCSVVMTSIDASASEPARRLRRPRFQLPTTGNRLGWTVVLVVVGLFLAVQVGREVYQSWQISEQAEAARAEIAQMEAANERLRAELQYLQSDAYISSQARALTGIGTSDEHLLIIPEGAEAPLPPELAPPVPAPKPLLEQWLDLFFGG